MSAGAARPAPGPAPGLENAARKFKNWAAPLIERGSTTPAAAAAAAAAEPEIQKLGRFIYWRFVGNPRRVHRSTPRRMATLSRVESLMVTKTVVALLLAAVAVLVAAIALVVC